jgi:hypothetical protein
MKFIQELPADARGVGAGNTGLRAPWRIQLQKKPRLWAELPIQQAPSRPSERAGYEFAVRGGKLYGRYIEEKKA